MPNKVFKQAFTLNLLDFTQDYKLCRMEAVCGESRLDACLTNENSPPLWVECKNVSLVEDNLAFFPDAPSARARKHLEELINRKKAGDNACMFFFIQRTDCCGLAPADFIDQEYAELFYLAMTLGVKMLAYKAEYSPAGVSLGNPVRVLSRDEYLHCGKRF